MAKASEPKILSLQLKWPCGQANLVGNGERWVLRLFWKVGTGATDSNADGHGWRFLAGCFKWGVPAWQGGQVMVGQDQDDGFVAEG